MTGRLETLEVARGVAASAVAFHHISLTMAEPRYFGYPPWRSVLFPGYHGVDFFFVLSGFIICYVHWKDVGRPGAVLRYAWRRLVRIIPAYWLVTGFVATLYLLAPNLGQPYQHDPWRIFTSLLLLPVGDAPVAGQGWTLIYEVFFYLLFGLIIWRPSLCFVMFPAWLVVIVLAIGHKSPTPAFSISAPVNLLFMMGIAACAIHRRHSPRHPLLWVAAGIATIAVVCVMEINFAPRFGGIGIAFDIRDYGATLVVGLASAVSVVGLASWEARSSPILPRPLRTLGAASYSIYLAHGVAISFGLTVLFKLRERIPINAGVTIVALICLVWAGGMLFWKTVELPLLRRFRAITVGRLSRAAPEAAE